MGIFNVTSESGGEYNNCFGFNDLEFDDHYKTYSGKITRYSCHSVVSFIKNIERISYFEDISNILNKNVFKIDAVDKVSENIVFQKVQNHTK